MEDIIVGEWEKLLEIINPNELMQNYGSESRLENSNMTLDLVRIPSEYVLENTNTGLAPLTKPVNLEESTPPYSSFPNNIHQGIVSTDDYSILALTVKQKDKFENNYCIQVLGMNGLFTSTNPLVFEDGNEKNLIYKNFINLQEQEVKKHLVLPMNKKLLNELYIRVDKR